MQLEYKKIEQIADNVQFILDNESKKRSNIKELEIKLNNLQNAMTAPFNSCFEDPEESKAFSDYLRKGRMSDFITKSLSTDAGEAGVSVVNTLNTKIISEINASSRRLFLFLYLVVKLYALPHWPVARFHHCKRHLLFIHNR